MSIIDVSGVSKSYGGVKANTDISMTVEEGGITGLIGPNGSGKTTLFNSIVGYHPIESVPDRQFAMRQADQHVFNAVHRAVDTRLLKCAKHAKSSNLWHHHFADFAPLVLYRAAINWMIPND